MRDIILDVRNRPLFTDTHTNIGDFIPDHGSIYIFGASPEERSTHLDLWKQKVTDVKFIQILEQDFYDFLVSVDSSKVRITLRDEDQLKKFLSQFSNKKVYIDITGLSHHIWAPLLKMTLKLCDSVMAVYVEPSRYSFSATLKEGEIFDLSEKINGIAPIPGFILLREPREEEKVCFIPLLGFEGARFAYLIEQVQPLGEKILPIIGLPGFRPEYPFFAYHGNQLPLKQTQAWKNVLYAAANCPFSLFYTLEDISSNNPGSFLKIAPIGTKPHALGAVLFNMINKESVELVYDHPIRKATRTEGSSRLLVYHLSSFNQFSS